MAQLRPLLAFIVLFVVGCGQQHTTESGLVYCSEGDPITFNPQQAISSTTLDATSKQLYNRLIHFDPKSGTYVPELATSWQISPDGLTYLFTLREHVPFHQTEYFQPSRFFTASDVVFSFQRWLDRSHPYYQIGGGRYPFFQNIGLDAIGLQVEQISKQQVRIQLKQPRPSLLQELATDFAVILSEEYGLAMLGRGQPQFLDERPIGTGPYQLHEYQRNQFIRYNRHEQYWGTPAKLTKLVFDITPSASARVIKLIGNDCDIATLPQLSELKTIQSYPDLALEQAPSLNTAYWAFNTDKAPFNHPSVRLALSYAIDKKRLLESVYHNTAVLAVGMLPPSSWAYPQPESAYYAYNPGLAQKLLAEADVGPIHINILTIPMARPYNPDPMYMARLIQQDLALIGVSSSIITYDLSRFLQLLNRAEYDSVLIGWNADTLDPDNFFTPLLSCNALVSGSNHARWCLPEFDELINQAKNDAIPQQRQILYKELEQMLRLHHPLVPLAHANRIIGRQREWQGQVLHTNGGIDFTQIDRGAL
ncbi:MAG: ABC transporter substrate-binding protein [Ferrimonas sp.]